MARPDRRMVLGGLFGTLGVTAGVSASHLDFEGSSRAQQLLANLLSEIDVSPAISGELKQLFDNGMTIEGKIGAGRYLIAGDSTRAIALLPVRYRDRSFDLPVVVEFAGSGNGDLKIAAMRMGAANPFDALQSPERTQTDPEMKVTDLQQRYDLLARSGGGILSIPAGEIATNLVLHSRRVHLTGAGRGATRLVPADPAKPVLSAVYRDASWNYVTISNLDIAGIGGRGTGFAAGADSYVNGDEFAGRTRFVNVGFAKLDIAIERRFGQIGLQLDQCTFGSAEYHLRSVANKGGRGEIMHAGIMTARDCHFMEARAAVAYFDSPRMGSGGVLFDNCVMERNPGFVFYVVAFGNTDEATDFVVRDCWNELNATGSNAQINGSRETICYAAFGDTAMVRFEGTPLGSLRLRNTVVHTYACPLDALETVDKDARSSLTHHEARGFGSYVPVGLAASIAGTVQSDPPGRALTFIVANRSSIVELTEKNVLLSLPAAEPFILTGNTSVRSRPRADAVLPGVGGSQQVTLKTGMKVFPKPVRIAARSWVVWLFAYRMVSGTPPQFQVTGDRGISFRRPLDSAGWQTLGGMAEVPTAAREISLWMMQDNGEAEIALGGYNLLTFPDRQQALEFLNSGHFAVTA